MPKTTHRLNSLWVANIKRPGLHPDGDGLYLKVGPTGSKSWVLRFMRGGKPRYLGLGSAKAVALAKARGLASQARQQIHAGIDPIAFRRNAAVEARRKLARSMTFEDCAETLIAAREASWRNAKHCAQWRSTLKAHVYPKIGSKPVADISTDDVLGILEPIWSRIPETASRVRGRVETILDSAKARGARDGDNPARWRGHLANLLPNTAKIARVKHHAALPYPEVSGFVRKLRDRECTAARALEFLILTAARTSEALRAEWGEFDLEARLWTIPATRMKAGKEHRVPLSPRACEIVKQLESLSMGDCVFQGAKPGQPLSNMGLLMLLRRMERHEITVHGFRSTFRDWAAEETDFPNHVVEMALAHAIENKVESAYRRGDLLERRRELMTAWSAYCSRHTKKGAKRCLKNPPRPQVSSMRMPGSI